MAAVLVAWSAGTAVYAQAPLWEQLIPYYFLTTVPVAWSAGTAVSDLAPLWEQLGALLLTTVLVSWLAVAEVNAQAHLWEQLVPCFWQQCRWLGHLSACDSSRYSGLPVPYFWQCCQWLGQLWQQSMLRSPCDSSQVPCFWLKYLWIDSQSAPDSSQCSNLLILTTGSPISDWNTCGLIHKVLLTAVSVQTCSWHQSVFKPAHDSSLVPRVICDRQTCRWIG